MPAGLEPPERGRVRWLKLGVAAAGAVAFLWAVAGALALVGAARDAAAAQQQVADLRAELSLDWAENPDHFLAQMAESEDQFRSVAHQARSWITVPWRILPVSGRQVRSLASLAGASADTLAIVGSTVDEVHSHLDHESASAGGRLEVLEAVSDSTAAAADQLAALDLGPDRGLVGPLAQARQRLAVELADAVDSIGTGAAVSRAVADLLAGPSRYLVLGANNAQMQAGAGMFLTVGVLSAQDGEIALSPMHPITDLALPDVPVPLETDLVARWAHAFDPNDDWRHLGMSARFPVNAQVAADMWQATAGEHLDGVIALDTVAVALLVGATGPVEVDGAPMAPDEVRWELLVGQYAALDRPDEQWVENAVRRERIGELAAEVFQQIEGGEVTSVDLGRALVDAVAGRHLMMWSRDPEAQGAWREAGVDGALGDRDVLLSLINRGGNKLDPYIEMAAVGHADPATDTVEIEVTIANRAPEGLPAYAAGPYPGTDLVAGEYLGLLTLSVGRAGATPEVVDHPVVVSGPEGAGRVAGLWVRLGPGEQTTRTFSVRVAESTRWLTVAPSARPVATHWIVDGREFDDDRRFTWRFGE